MSVWLRLFRGRPQGGSVEVFIFTWSTSPGQAADLEDTDLCWSGIPRSKDVKGLLCTVVFDYFPGCKGFCVFF